MPQKFIKFTPEKGNKAREFIPEQRPLYKKFNQFYENPEIVKLKEDHQRELNEVSEVAWNTGYEQAKAEARGEYEHRVNTMQNLVDNMGRMVEMEKRRMIERIAQGFPKIIWQLIRLFFTEKAEEMGESLLRRVTLAVDILIAEPGMVVKLHPKDMKIVRGNLDFPGREIRLMASPDVRPGGFMIEAGFAEVDGNIQSFVDKYIDEIVRK